LAEVNVPPAFPASANPTRCLQICAQSSEDCQTDYPDLFSTTY
jgi:hypothetical protein